ncbi:FAD-dependent oxidoreductase [Epilithonimonas pallida]|uniref:Glycerol-3-phosphate dehydrogenase n=1 Tax=Epilithonimonas pallida TaxID=373671 RepID=A0ABY1R7B2_9FLAO|nr:glycerol-3-phosphate dehydrogenase/oxidase [Epilithonimonas pallida]SMP93946.1 glycerol-3-phosphate dehydrogenase [Epilithonimonas pallida]
MKRKNQISKLTETQNWDVIVIGGGASGLGTALDSTLRGYKTVLFEIKDFAKGTSSRSTKLVHGGVRYLAQGDIKLVKEALRERGLLAKNAAHLVKDQSFVIPNYSWWGGPFYFIGLTIYDFLAGKLSIGKTKYLNKKNVLQKLPAIKSSNLASGILYHDGQFDDSRLAINLVQSTVENGGTMINYMGVTGLSKDNNGQLNGVIVKDEFTGKTYHVKGKVIVNATGVFTDDILNMNNTKHKKMVVPSQGIHLVLDKSFFPGEEALMIPKTSDGRVLFAVPWHNKVVVGTTDTLIKDTSFEPRALEKEIEFVLETARNYLVKAPTRKDVLSVFAGLRPLAAPEKEGQSTKEVSRSHKIMISDSGLVTVIGGKWTTYREMAEEIVDEASKVADLPEVSCKTHHFSIHGNIPASHADQSDHLYIYGSDIPEIKKLQQSDAALKQKIHPKYDATYAEVLWAIECEMAETLEDVLARRIRFLFTDARAAIDIAEDVAQFMAQRLGKSEEWAVLETKNFIELAKGYLLEDYSPKKETQIIV